MINTLFYSIENVTIFNDVTWFSTTTLRNSFLFMKILTLTTHTHIKCILFTYQHTDTKINIQSSQHFTLAQCNDNNKKWQLLYKFTKWMPTTQTQLFIEWQQQMIFPMNCTQSLCGTANVICVNIQFYKLKKKYEIKLKNLGFFCCYELDHYFNNSTLIEQKLSCLTKFFFIIQFQWIALSVKNLKTSAEAICWMKNP